MNKLRKLPLLMLLALWALALIPIQAQTNVPFRVYLAFEDGPTNAYTPQILDTLASYGAKASFVIAGGQIEGHEEIIRRELREGHALINHLWTEPTVYAGATDDVVIESYLRTEAALREALGAELLPIYEAQTKMFWQPGGATKALPYIPDVDVITYNWSVNSDDCGWKIPSDVDLDTLEFDEAVIDNVLNTPRSEGQIYNVYDYGEGVVVIFHDLNRVTGRVLPVVLAELQSAGATFERLPRPFDEVGTLAVRLGVPPIMGEGIVGAQLHTVTINDYVNVRSIPATDGRILTTLTPNTTITAIGRTDGWIQVAIDGNIGWIARSLLKVYGPIPALPESA